MARPIWLTVAQAARIYRVPAHSIRNWVRRGNIVMSKAGRVDAASIENYLNNRGVRGQHRARRGPGS